MISERLSASETHTADPVLKSRLLETTFTFKVCSGHLINQTAVLFSAASAQKIHYIAKSIGTPF